MSGYGSVDALYSSERIPLNLRRYVGWLIDTQTPLVFLWVAGPFVVRAYDIGRRFVLLLLYPLAVVAMYLAYLNFTEWGYLRFLLPAYPVVLASLAATLVIFARNARHRRLAVAAVATITLLLLFDEGRFARNAGAFRIAEGEQRFARAVDFTRTLAPNAIVFSEAYSGTLRLYSQREVLRWLWIPPEHLDLALADLKKQGYRPYFLGDPFEVEAFKEYFNSRDAVMRFDGQAWRPFGESFVVADLTPP
jgi:hypothetical protein